MSTLQQMGCWHIVDRPENVRVMHIKFVLKRKRDQKEEVCKHKASLVVCDTEEAICQEDTFSLVAHYFIFELIFYFFIQRERTVRRIDFETAFRNRQLERPV